MYYSSYFIIPCAFLNKRDNTQSTTSIHYRCIYLEINLHCMGIPCPPYKQLIVAKWIE